MVWYILIAILMFGLLIAVHEFGHFATAKLLGVRVNEFAIGMGPLLWSKQRGETRYSLRAIPIGGFCAMEGEEEASDDPRSFSNKAAWKKFLILVAGAAMNFLAGLVLILVVFSLSGLPAQAVVSGYLPGGEDIAKQGLLPGDQICRIDGHAVYFRSDALLYMDRAGDEMTVEILRGGARLTLELDLPRRIQTVENGVTVWKRGIRMGGESQAATPASILKSAWYQAIDDVRIVWMGLGDLVTGRAGLQDMGGPILIVQMVGEAGEQGAQAAQQAGASPAAWALVNILNFVSFIAINLAVMNLLPIPALDGGRIFFLLVNGLFTLVTRRKLDPKYESYVNAAGFLCLLGLMAVVAFNDVMKLLH